MGQDQAHLINLVSQFLAWAVRNGNDDLRLVMEYAGQQLVKEVMQDSHLESSSEHRDNDQPREEVMPTAEVHLAESPPASLSEGTLDREIISDLRDKLTAAHVRLQQMAAETARKREVNYAAQKRWREEQKKKRKGKNGAKRKGRELNA